MPAGSKVELSKIVNNLGWNGNGGAVE